ncbi:Major facilitator superfamily domain general substrate transporter [Botryosphaeria dothidea]|uniref:Major facilitator superfamily domain general substrate transporter n=1 Tax=Botryosphaeria dothidea TaxID=55169 RepID=A0A8H4NB66_9PEZI|nr:Major facilitator superfamily domain general substrate transporter [Botryosphaeria dothidea]
MGLPVVSTVVESWHLFSAKERRNIALYILGIMLYKFGLEAFNGSITALATNRYDYDAEVAGTPKKTFERVGLLQGLNQAFQCVGAILIAPLIKRWPTRLVLSCAIVMFGLLTAILLIVDAATGGRIRPSSITDDEDFSYYGDYNTDGMIPIYTIAGIAYGMVELIRRVIPRDIVGGNVQKLRRMDALVHIFYEVAGTSGAFCTALGLIPALGNNMSFIITPICFALAAISWFFISNLGFMSTDLEKVDSPNYFKAILNGARLFVVSVWTGAKLIFTSRKMFWLLPGYTIALYGHRYLENGIAPAIARRYLGNSAWSQIMVGGSNFGELLGALFVFLFTNFIKTPIPWLRLDALTLLIVWYLPYWNPPRNDVSQAWIVAATFLPVSFGWAAGDVSLAAYIQATLARKESEEKDLSPLGAVMAFLYATYIVMYAIASPLLGRYVDRINTQNDGDISPAIQNIAGVQFTLICVIVLSATLIPKGALALNPQNLYGEKLDRDLDEEYAQEVKDGDELAKDAGSSNDEKEVLEHAARKGSVTVPGVL